MNQGAIPPNSTFSFQVPPDQEATRLDAYVAQQFPAYSRSFFKELIERELVSINKKTITKPGKFLKPADIVAIHFPPTPEPQPATVSNEELGVEIIHEHEHFFVIHKPAGLLVHPPSPKNRVVSLIDWIHLNHKELTNVGYIDRPGIVHRLDKDTSGLLIIARTNYAHGIFSALFKNRSIHKTYLALVRGHPEKEGTIDLAIGRHPVHRTKMATYPSEQAQQSANIRSALTHYKVLEYFDDCSLVEIKLITGRTHQIRAHFSAIGHSLVGDQTYGKNSKLINRQALHARDLSFVFENKKFSFSKKLPDDLEKLVEKAKTKLS